MKFIDDQARDELAKSSTILQCMIQMLDFECNKFHFQPELIGVEQDVAMINCDPMNYQEIIDACNKVNSQFKRKDGQLSCVLNEMNKTFVLCRASELEQYHQLT